MRYLFSKIPFILAIIIVLFVGLLAFNGCQNEGQIIPVYEPVAPPPPELSIEKIYNDYMANAKEAEAEYSGERFLFSGLVVDYVESWLLNPKPTDISITVGNVKLKPRYEIDFDEIGPGFVIDVTGVPQSLFLDRILIINDCLVYIIEGGDIEVPPGY